MTISRIARRMDEIGSAWEQFKSANDRRLSEIEKRGAADPLTVDQVNRLSAALDGYQDRLSKMETSMSRPDMSGEKYFSLDPVSGEHKAAFCNYLRKGVDDDLSFLEQKALSVSSDPDGGYLVTPQVSERIVRTVYETSPLRRVAAIEEISSDSLEILEDNSEAAAGWTSETASVAETASPTLGKKIIPVHEVYAQPKATQKLIDDSSIDVENWLSDKLSDIFSRKENSAFVSGDGVGKPRGFTTYANGTSWGEVEQIDSGSSGNVTSDSLVSLYYSLKEEYSTHATWMMNRATVEQVRLLKESSTNQYMWQPGLMAGAPDTLLGVPVIQAADMASPAAGSLSVAIADFSRAYQIVDRTGIRVLRDPFTEKPFVKFYSTKRVGGDVVNFEAIKLLKLA